MTTPFAAPEERANRILAEKLRLLYRGNFAVPANLPIAIVVAYVLRDTFPHLLLTVWVVATGLVVGLRLLLYRRFLRAATARLCSKCWARRFMIGACASGLLWGGLCLGLPVWGNATQFVFMMVVTTGLTAGALTSIAIHLPAYFAYAGSFILPLAVVSLMHEDPKIAANGLLLFLFIAVIGWAARNLSRLASRTIELNVDNQLLQGSLIRACGERDAARTEKWSTLAQLSHELRTPLNAILGFSEAMQGEVLGPLGSQRYRDYAGYVHDSGSHLLTLTDQILQLSQGESGELEMNEGIVDVAEVVGGCVDVMLSAAQKAKLSLRADVSSRVPPLRADATKLRQMLLNLVDNAVKFTSSQGAVSIEARPGTAGGIDLVVRDTGIGMKTEDIAIALQPFGRIASPLKHQTEGVGLGLPICKRLAELHGAELFIRSEPGKGTACTISFPAWRSMAADAVAA